MIVVELSEAEIQSVTKLFDTAVRSGGLPAAAEALPILAKIQQAMNAKQPGDVESAEGH